MQENSLLDLWPARDQKSQKRRPTSLAKLKVKIKYFGPMKIRVLKESMYADVNLENSFSVKQHPPGIMVNASNSGGCINTEGPQMTLTNNLASMHCIRSLILH